MKEYKVTPDQRNIYRKFPIRITGKNLSSCHNVPTVIVQSMEGGFVTRNCSICGKKETLPQEVFKSLELWVACPNCKKAMSAEMIEGNYCYLCKSCDTFIKFSDLLPDTLV
jgi:hypothetical protein